MERESFEDREVAGILNEHFVAIKVDREERPDVDHIYMTVCQMLTGQGGWPLTIMMTPDKKPFFAGTYYPKTSKWGQPGLVDILQRVAVLWRENREQLSSLGAEITEGLQCMQRPPQEAELTADLLEEGYRQLEAAFEPEYGGFSAAPKFPTPHNMMFLLRYWRQTGKQQALAMVEKTLTAMYQGGIYDQLGYGFARYSTDKQWLVPHFEKMLYDNALLCITYLEAYQCTGNAEFARVAGEILAYAARDMTDSEGGFYSAEDADSEGVEGKFYVFTRQEILDSLGEQDGRVFADFYGVTEDGNFEGTNILHCIGQEFDAFCRKVGLAEAEAAKLLAAGRQKLFALREQRIHPHKDDKILTAWNALMIVACAKAGRILARPEYTKMAQRALEFIYKRLFRQDGRLLARYRDGQAAFAAYLDDYAYLLWALTEAYEAVFQPVYLERALALYTDLKKLFWDEEHGGFFFYGADSEVLLTRPKELYDGALPSGNSVAALALQRLARLTENTEVARLADRQLAAFAHEAGRHPKAYTFFLMAVSYYLAAPRQIVVAGPGGKEDTLALLAQANSRFLPDTVLLLHAAQQQNGALLPPLVDKQPVGGKAAAYLCDQFGCRPPVTEAALLGKMLQ